jgi:integrase
VTREQVKAWRDNLLEKGVSPRTVERECLRSVKSVYSFAIREDRLSESPAKGVAVQAARRQKRKQMRGFNDDEARAILRATLLPLPEGIGPKLRATLRWFPWILAYCGARVTEITQLARGMSERSTATGAC